MSPELALKRPSASLPVGPLTEVLRKRVSVMPESRPCPDADLGEGSRGNIGLIIRRLRTVFVLRPVQWHVSCIMSLDYRILLQMVGFDGMSKLRRHQSRWQEVLRTVWRGIASTLSGLRQRELCGNEILWGLRRQPNFER